MRRHPFALVVEFADDVGADVVAPVVELLLDLILDHLALFFDHQDFFQPVGEFAHAVRLERPWHCDLEQAQAHLRRHRCVDAERFERFEDVEVGLAGGDDAEPGVGTVDGSVVELVRPRIRQRGVDLVVLHQRFLFARLQAERIGRQLRIQAAFGHDEVGRNGHLHAVRVGVDRGARLDRVGQRLEGDGAAGEARHGPAVHAEVEVFLDVARIQQRHHVSGEDMVGLVRQGRRVGAMVVTGHQQHAAVAAGASVVHVFKNVAAAVDAGTLAVPHGEHAVVVGRADQVDGLGALHGAGGEVFVDAGNKTHVVRFEVALGLPQRFIEAAEGRAAVAGDEAGGI